MTLPEALSSWAAVINAFLQGCGWLSGARLKKSAQIYYHGGPLGRLLAIGLLEEPLFSQKTFVDPTRRSAGSVGEGFYVTSDPRIASTYSGPESILARFRQVPGKNILKILNDYLLADFYYKFPLPFDTDLGEYLWRQLRKNPDLMRTLSTPESLEQMTRYLIHSFAGGITDFPWVDPYTVGSERPGYAWRRLMERGGYYGGGWAGHMRPYTDLIETALSGRRMGINVFRPGALEFEGLVQFPALADLGLHEKLQTFSEPFRERKYRPVDLSDVAERFLEKMNKLDYVLSGKTERDRVMRFLDALLDEPALEREAVKSKLLSVPFEKYVRIVRGIKGK